MSHQTAFQHSRPTIEMVRSERKGDVTESGDENWETVAAYNKDDTVPAPNVSANSDDSWVIVTDDNLGTDDSRKPLI